MEKTTGNTRSITIVQLISGRIEMRRAIKMGPHQRQQQHAPIERRHNSPYHNDLPWPSCTCRTVYCRLKETNTSPFLLRLCLNVHWQFHIERRQQINIFFREVPLPFFYLFELAMYRYQWMKTVFSFFIHCWPDLAAYGPRPYLYQEESIRWSVYTFTGSVYLYTVYKWVQMQFNGRSRRTCWLIPFIYLFVHCSMVRVPPGLALLAQSTV